MRFGPGSATVLGGKQNESPLFFIIHIIYPVLYRDRIILIVKVDVGVDMYSSLTNCNACKGLRRLFRSKRECHSTNLGVLFIETGCFCSNHL